MIGSMEREEHEWNIRLCISITIPYIGHLLDPLLSVSR